MFLPLFIAILLGFASPSNTNNNCSHNSGTTVSTNDTDPGDTDPGDGGDNGDDTGGEGAHVPPKNP